MIASGQNSALCRVVAGLRSPWPYIPGVFCHDRIHLENLRDVVI